MAAPALVPTKVGGSFHPLSSSDETTPACHQHRFPPPAKAKVWMSFRCSCVDE
ncbi:MAG TPA: hypothetical protein PL140_09250 [Ferrovaceae bacterium]|uniref:hypothetical protein n=1 Tax=Ferrovum sp. JA12 TaxID=1356299 RepID=UPI00195566D9|nr:hypothetical protein [Ferrovum sp. JA12]HQT82438.1 hypothetical protein [Ferrovaceae bacterium]HQU07404.1 hypothetical protein [Ferrovaceae bacterium]